MAGSDEDVLGQALAWVREGRVVAMATVVETWGSSPRPRGSQLAIRDDGLFVGSVSGGCVEAKVVEVARRAMHERAPRMLEFGVSDDDAWGVGLACGGTVRILVEAVEVNRGALETAAEAMAAKRPVVVVTPLEGGTTKVGSPEDGELGDLAEAARRALQSDDAHTVATPAGPMFIRPLNPPLRLVVVGAVHVAGPLSAMAEVTGYEVTIVDPRQAFARAERWPPGAVVRAEWPDEALPWMGLDARTAVVALTHDPKIDDPALVAALRSRAFYVGALGSKKTHAARLQRLAEMGFAPAELARIHGPVGLDIGARSPGEIAIAILGQMTAALRKEFAASKAARPVAPAGV
jgi:xanthine dehydrogenase accessory factor